MPQFLYAVPFALEDRELFADFSCGDEPWSLASAEWIQGGGVERSVTQHGTQVWLFRRDSDDQLIGFLLCMSRTRGPGGFTSNSISHDGVITRATRAAKYLPRTLITVEVTGDLTCPVGALPTVGERL